MIEIKPFIYDIKPGSDSRYMKILRFCLRVIGIWRSTADRSRNPVLIFMILSYLLTGLLGTVHHLLFSKQDLHGGTEVVMNISLISHTTFVYVVLVWKQPTIMKMMSVVENRFEDFSFGLFRENESFITAERFNTILVMTITAIIFSVHMSFIAVSKVYLIYLPFEKKSFMFPVSTPFELTEWSYYAIYAVEVVITILEAVIHISSIAVCTGFINLLCSSFATLGRAFRHAPLLAQRQALLCAGVEMSPGWTRKMHLDHHANQLLKDLVNHHLLLNEFYKDLQSTFGILVLEMFINSQIMLCSCGFNVFKLFQERAVEQLFKQLCMFAALISHEFVYFWFGSRLTQQVERFRSDVHASPWLLFNPRFQRGYRIVQERLKRPTIIHGVVINADLVTFAKCLQAALSYFNILLALSYKQDKAQSL